MRNIIPGILSGMVLLFAGSNAAEAQAFTAAKDTVSLSFSKTATMNDMLTNITADNRVITWHVVNSDFPPDWLTGPAFGICDNMTCLSNLGNMLWDATTGKADTNKSIYYANATHDSAGSFGLSMDLSKATTTGTHWMKVNVTDSVTGQSKDLMFIITKSVNAVVYVQGGASVSFYPNPAKNELNFEFNGNIHPQAVNVYNIAGVMLGAYIASGSNMTIDVSHLPPGAYFARCFSDERAETITFEKQ